MCSEFGAQLWAKRVRDIKATFDSVRELKKKKKKHIWKGLLQFRVKGCLLLLLLAPIDTYATSTYLPTCNRIKLKYMQRLMFGCRHKKWTLALSTNWKEMLLLPLRLIDVCVLARYICIDTVWCWRMMMMMMIWGLKKEVTTVKGEKLRNEKHG